MQIEAKTKKQKTNTSPLDWRHTSIKSAKKSKNLKQTEFEQKIVLIFCSGWEDKKVAILG